MDLSTERSVFDPIEESRHYRDVDVSLEKSQANFSKRSIYLSFGYFPAASEPRKDGRKAVSKLIEH